MLKVSAEAGWVAVRESCHAKTPVPQSLDVNSTSILGPQSPGKPCSVGDMSSPHHDHKILEVTKESVATLFCW